MRKNKILAMILVLATFMSLGSTVLAARVRRPSTPDTVAISKVVSSVSVTFKEPEAGELFSQEIETTSTGIEKVTITWLNSTNFMTVNEKYQEGSKYEARIYVTLKEGYSWADTVTINVNGVDKTATKASNGQAYVSVNYTATKSMTIHKIEAVTKILTPKVGVTATRAVTLKTEGVEMYKYYFAGEKLDNGRGAVAKGTHVYMDLKEGYTLADDAVGTIDGHEVAIQKGAANRIYMIYEPAEEAKAIDTVEVTVKEPVLGGLPNEELTVKTEGLANAYMAWINSETGVMMNSTEKYQDGEKYIAKVFARPDDGYKWADKVTFKINGKEVAGTKVAGENTLDSMYGELEFTVGTVKKAIDTVVISYDEPVAGEAHNNKVTTKTEGIEKATMSWVNKTSGVFMIKNEEYKVGSTYEARIFVYQEEGYKWADKVTFKINGKNVEGTTTATSAQTTMTYTLKEEKTEEKPEEKPEEKVEYPWTEASDWAEEELIEANENKLIPTCLEDANYTKNITRAEFAAAAVKLYEGITKTKAVAVANNPFTDTKDSEVLKAYNIGITNGTSETTFEPNAEITREQMATMMTRALTKAGIDTKRPSNATKFTDDAEFSDWASDSVYYMSSKEIIKGVGDNKFEANGTATREQALLVSVRSLKKLGE